jgi:hypothetical protein
MRSMVEGSLAPAFEDRARTSQLRAFYPSTTLRVVPLPIFNGEANQKGTSLDKVCPLGISRY